MGVFLLILGAIFAFAVRADSEVVDLQTVGLILMVAGGALVYYGRRGTTRVHETRTVDDLSDPHRPVHTVHDSVTIRDPSLEHDSPRP